MIRLVLAPHGDDEVLGCGGVLAKYPAESTVFIVSHRGDSRHDETGSAAKILGYKGIIYGDFHTGQLYSEMRKLITTFDRLINDARPDVLYVPFPSMHQDHMAVYEAGLRSARLGFSGRRHYVPTVLVYDVSAYTSNLYETGLKWNHYEALTEEQIDLKVKAFSEYESQQDGNVDSSALKDEARVLGHQHGVPFAERYAVVRQVAR